jgi:hypothetical protein
VDYLAGVKTMVEQARTGPTSASTAFRDVFGPWRESRDSFGSLGLCSVDGPHHTLQLEVEIGRIGEIRVREDAQFLRDLAGLE